MTSEATSVIFSVKYMYRNWDFCIYQIKLVVYHKYNNLLQAKSSPF